MATCMPWAFHLLGQDRAALLKQTCTETFLVLMSITHVMMHWLLVALLLPRCQAIISNWESKMFQVNAAHDSFNPSAMANETR